MYRQVTILFILYLVVSCTPKLATKDDAEEYSEDVSEFRPQIEDDESESLEVPMTNFEKGPYVAPTHSINREMNVVMDSIVVHNSDKTYTTYTIQVYIGRSREEANQVREKVYRVLPDEKPQLTYKQPSYKVNVGRYFDRVEAYKTLTTLRGTFPSAMLVPERNRME